jgi:CheY-like chemotaxis protein
MCWLALPFSFFWREKVIILIVDDNPAIRQLIKRTIGPLATKIYECIDGADALAAYTNFHPDLVFMDLRMPRMDGFAATKQIRQRYPEARIVIVTDYDVEDFRTAAIAAGAIGYALKDDLTELRGFIARGGN